jgi:hypothetical protein
MLKVFSQPLHFSPRDGVGLKQQPSPYWHLVNEAKTVHANVYLSRVLTFELTLPSYRTSVCVYVKWLNLQLFITLKTSSIKPKTPDLKHVLRQTYGYLMANAVRERQRQNSMKG